MGLFWSPIAFSVIFLHHSLSGSTFTEAAVLLGPLTLIELFICLSIWYPCKAIPIDRHRFAAVLGRHALSALMFVSIWLGVGFIYSRILSDLTENPVWRDMYPGALPLLLAAGFFLYFTFSLIYYMVLALDRGRKAEQTALENQLSASAAELNSLKASIHPHFLFNSLTSLSALTITSPEQAQKMCLQLADFLRYSLNYGKQEWVRIRDELDHIEDYLAIEKIRLGSRLHVEYAVEPATEEDRLPPFTLLPLVENAVKHGFQASLDAGTLAVTIRKDVSALAIEVANPFERAAVRADRNEGGHGLRGLRKRLHNAYGDNAKLRISKDTDVFKVTLRLPSSASSRGGKRG